MKSSGALYGNPVTTVPFPSGKRSWPPAAVPSGKALASPPRPRGDSGASVNGREPGTSDYMDDDASKANPTADFNKIDLSQLQGFSFGTSWAKDKEAPSQARDHSDRPHRDDRGGPGGAPDRRDRRAFRKPAGDGPSSPPPREGQGDRGPRRDSGDYGAPRRNGPGMDRQERADRGPYDSPYFNVFFFPEDTSFNALVKTIRTSARTIRASSRSPAPCSASPTALWSSWRASRGPPAPRKRLRNPSTSRFRTACRSRAKRRRFRMCLGLTSGITSTAPEVEVEPPKGNFLVINKCGVTGELLGPPNYHRYNQMIQQHHAAKVARMSFEAFKARIETVRDPEVVNQWLEKMKKVTRYTSKAPVPEGQSAPAFDGLEEARAHLLANARDTVVKPVESARFHGKALETMPRGEILMAIEGAYDRQLRFPLDTANQLRGRLRREHFTIFKKGSKGVSYVCAVKRKFRVPGQVFGESIGNLISYIEEHPLVKAGELASKMLGINAPAEGESMTPEQREKIMRMQGDLIWLVREGYVTEFIDGGLYAPPAMVEARKKEVEAEENDPENFPEAPRVQEQRAPAPAAEAAAPAVGTAPPAQTAPSEEAPDVVEPPVPEPTAPVVSSEADLPPVA